MKKIKSITAGLALSAGLLATASSANAVEIEVALTNLTQGMSFTPRLLVAHTDALSLFQPGTIASPELISVAEGGDTSGFVDLLATVPDLNSSQVFGGLASPASTVVYSFDTGDFAYLSMVSMLVPTNDAFVGLNTWEIPTEPGTYTIELNAYDAGSEANTEIAGDMPDPATSITGSGATGVADSPEGNVHIHRNVLGDTDDTGGISDLDATVHRWLNPVARLTITIPAP